MNAWLVSVGEESATMDSTGWGGVMVAAPVEAHVSEVTGVERREGSTPSPGPQPYEQERSSTVEQHPPNVQVGGSIPSALAIPPIPAEIPPSLALSQRATARVASVGGVLSEAEVRGILVEAGAPPDWIDPLVAISWCESKHSPGAIGDSGNSLGQYQLWYGWFRAAGEDLSMWADPVVNARVAVYVRTVRGRFGGGGGWSCAALVGVY